MLKDYDRYETEELVLFYRESFDAITTRNLLEYKLFNKLRVILSKDIFRIQTTSKKIAMLDVLISFSILSSNNNYNKPIITNDKNINIDGGRHCVVEKLTPFVPNDINMTNKSLHIIT